MSKNKSLHRILVLDDDTGVVDYLVEALQEEGYTVTGCTSPRQALLEVAEGDFDLVVADIEMPEMRGTEFLEATLRARPTQLVILITAFGSIDLAVQTVRAGAADFVTKPFKLETLLVAIERSLRERQMRREIVRLRTKLVASADHSLVVESKAMQRVLEVARRTANTDLTVLVTGESGTGKGALARFVHESSRRHTNPFVQVNCAALPENLIESELFGAHKGAFTDAKQTRAGLFVEANGGTLLLDEIGDMPLSAQAKLLQVLETGRIRPLGSASDVAVDVRIIAATNRPLEDALRTRQFRPDLYYRLNIIRLELPPLRERHEDILHLVDVFLQRASDRLDRPVLGVSAAAARRLLGYEWPGNVRELLHTIERAVALCDHDILLAEDLWFTEQESIAKLSADASPWQAVAQQGKPLAEVERAYIREVLACTGGNKVHAARILDIDRRTLRRKLNVDPSAADDDEQDDSQDNTRDNS